MSLEKVIEFAKKQGYESVEKLEKWKEYDVYEPIYKNDEVSIIGMPLLILVKGEEIRMSTVEEALEQLSTAE